MSPSTGIALAPGRGFRSAQIEGSIASILYINAVSILDEAAKSVLTEQGVPDPGGLGDRLRALRRRVC